MIFAVYYTNTGKIIQTLEGPSFYVNMLEFDDGVSIVEIPRQADDSKEIISNGKLVKNILTNNEETQ